MIDRIWALLPSTSSVEPRIEMVDLLNQQDSIPPFNIYLVSQQLS